MNLPVNYVSIWFDNYLDGYLTTKIQNRTTLLCELYPTVAYYEMLATSWHSSVDSFEMPYSSITYPGKINETSANFAKNWVV